MPGFEDIFGDFDEIVDENLDESADEWDAGGLWDTGEKENIWRTSAPSAPGDVWNCGGGCGDCDTDCDADGQPNPPEAVRPNDPISESIAGPCSAPVEDNGVEESLGGGDSETSEYDEMDEYDNFLDGDTDSEDEDDSPVESAFDDIW